MLAWKRSWNRKAEPIEEGNILTSLHTFLRFEVKSEGHF
jgi:hypothetical protein